MRGLRSSAGPSPRGPVEGSAAPDPGLGSGISNAVFDDVLDRLAADLADRIAQRLAERFDRRPLTEPAGDTLITVNEAARRLGTSRRWVYARANTLPFVRRLGRTVRVSAFDLERWMRAQRAG